MIDINLLLTGFVRVHEEVLFVRASSRDAGFCEIGGVGSGLDVFFLFLSLFFFLC